MVEYNGSRRAVEPLSPARAQGAFAEDDAAQTCPECGAAVRAGQEWCTLCMHVFRTAQAPRPVVAAVAIAASTPAVPAPVSDAPVSDAPDAADSNDSGSPVRSAETPRVSDIDVDAAADALLAQLAVEVRKDRLNVPSYLDSKARVAAFVSIAVVTLSAVTLGVLSVLGHLVH